MKLKNIIKPIAKNSKIALCTLIGATMISSSVYAIDKEKIAYQTFQNIMEIPDQKNAITPAQNYLLKKRVANLIVKKYCDKIGNNDGKVDLYEMKEGLDLLNYQQDKIADKYFGNNDGKTDFDEINNLITSQGKYPQLMELRSINIRVDNMIDGLKKYQKRK